MLADWIVWALAAYVFAGAVFAVAFVIRGVDRVDSVAPGSGVGFRLIIVPGVVALWPILLRRWASASPRPVERNAHRDAVRREADS